MSNISVLSQSVKFSDGLFCINDLHKASGGEKKHSPNYFIGLDSTKALIKTLIDNTGNPVIKTSAGRFGGTYVCEDLVYSYAMWISPEFQIKVIHAFKNQEKVKKSLDSIGAEVRKATASITSKLNMTALAIEEIKQHGSSWGAYGQAIKKAKKDAVKELDKLKDEIQLKLDLLS